MFKAQAVPDKDFFYDFDFEFDIPEHKDEEKIAREAFKHLSKRGRDFLKLYCELTPYSFVYVVNASKDDKIWIVARICDEMGAITKVEYKEECAGEESSTGFEYLPPYTALNLYYLD